MAACRMSDIFHHHVPVLLEEAVTHLFTLANGIYVDATFGRGSHARAILDRLGPAGKLIAFDKDPEAVAYAQQHFAQDTRFTIVHGSFAGMRGSLEALQVSGKVNGILFDLGVSSPQLDNPDRGFSFSKSGKLDMRMDTSQGMDAMTWIAQVDEKSLADVLYQFGEEKFSRRIARAIVEARTMSPITTTAQLADIIRLAMPKPQKPHDKHPATRSFQAIRIAVNQELSDLEAGLQQALDVLALGGRLSVISFHSLEDRIVKQFIKQHEKGQDLPRGLPVKGTLFNARLRSIGKPIKPGLKEIHQNPRARSAILRIAEKLS
ncbi:Ribosomal RNA small subunit methyltransferase H [Aquicella siphonis]|uniref:Ribosomal RNA small subunit methyltransferase H n=1 Tax=Aquicella siphonis TaxID=254247 RepID=A0A5E4PJ21_9COXI|nr:16S rRNA (cytosine(1402)-N(4))-methyltransferase RsmH [Aquicella siphonis]VVC76351.1 Ribosomal RNA small subunit methyltransferase H [Aquicella siphonis]